MQKYFLKTETGEEGPFTPEELIQRGINSESLIKMEGVEAWLAAGQIDELRSMLAAPASEPIAATEALVETQSAVTEEPAPATTPVAETQAPVVAMETAVPVPESGAAPAPASQTATAVASPPAKPPRRKGNPVITWVLSLAVLGGTGYYIYQDIEKNKNAETDRSVNEMTLNDSPSNTTTDPAINNNQESGNDTTIENPSMDTTSTQLTEETNTANTDPDVKNSMVPDNTDAAKKAEEMKKQAAAIAKKKEDEKKKQLAAAEAKKKEDEKKRLLAAQALEAKEREMRNGWVRYITIGSYNTGNDDDKVKPFTIPIYNSFNVPVERVVIRVDYLKKEKNVGTETLVLNNIPAKGSATIQTAGNKKAKTANVYITGAGSRQLHFCYPSTGGRAGDPYYCN